MQSTKCYIFLTLLSLSLLHGCAGRTTPAPVTLLNSQETPHNETYETPTYTVQRGDTLFAVAWYTGNDYRDLAKYNNLSAPYTIFPGQILTTSPPQKTTIPRVRPVSKAKQPTGLTTLNKSKRIVDQKKSEAYREGEKVVDSQNVTTVKNSSKSVKKTTPTSFPHRVKQWVWPASGKVVGTFSTAESGNKGIDIAGVKGSNVLAAADGKVVYSGSALRGYGNLVIIKHTDSFLSAYAYNDTIIVKEREWVSAGQKIATMGNSGTDSVKLHFEVRYRGKSLNPMAYLPPTKE